MCLKCKMVGVGSHHVNIVVDNAYYTYSISIHLKLLCPSSYLNSCVHAQGCLIKLKEKKNYTSW